MLIQPPLPRTILTSSADSEYEGDGIYQQQASVYLTSPTIRVVVGQEPNQKVFFVHEGLICPRSEFFRNAMKPQWVGAEERRVDLRQEDPAKFAWYLEILYSGVLSTKGQPFALQPVCELYVLAEMLMDDTTKEVILEVIRDRVRDHRYEHYTPEPAAICTIYEGTPETSPARRLIVEMCTQRAAKADIEDWSTKNLPKDFLLELSVSLIANRPLSSDHNQVHAKWSAERDSFATYDDRFNDRPEYQCPQPKVKKTKKRPADDDKTVDDNGIDLRPYPRKKRKPRKVPAHHVVDGDDLPMEDLLWAEDLAFLDDWSLRSDGNSGNTKTEVRLSPQHDNTHSSLNVTRNERTADWGAKVREEESGVTVRRDLLSSRTYYW